MSDAEGTESEATPSLTKDILKEWQKALLEVSVTTFCGVHTNDYCSNAL